MRDYSTYILDELMVGTVNRPHDFKWEQSLVWFINERLYIFKSPHQPHKFIVNKDYFWVVEKNGSTNGPLHEHMFHTFVAARNKYLAERILIEQDIS